MKGFADKLPDALAKSLPPVIIVAGDEPLQHMEACDLVRARARDNGVEERDILHVDANLSWGRLTGSAASQSPFGWRKLSALHLGGAKPGGQEGGKALQEYAEQAHGTDNILLISCAKLDA